MKKRICKVLFIGNSHTYYNDMVYMLKYFSEVGDTKYTIDPVMLAHPGRSLEVYKKEPEVRFNILYGSYDYIVLQQAAHPFAGKNELLRDALSIKKFIDQTKAIPISYMTWAEKSKPEKQKLMTNAYIELTKRMNGILCPVGIAWQEVINNNKSIELYNTDGEHASITGAYLVACVFYSVIMKVSPIGLPNKILFGEQIICDIPEDIACILQQIAWKTVQNFY